MAISTARIEHLTRRVANKPPGSSGSAKTSTSSSARACWPPGWQAHTLDAPGKFLVSAAEHNTPRRGRAYLITDEVVADTADLYADLRPPLDEVSRQAIEERNRTEPAAAAGEAGDPNGPSPNDRDEHGSAGDDPEVILWAALSLAPDDGATVPELMTATGMSRPWIYLRLRELAERGEVIQVSRGRWQAVSGDDE